MANMTVQCSIVSLDLCLLASGNVFFSDLNITIYTSLTGRYTRNNRCTQLQQNTLKIILQRVETFIVGNARL